MCWGTPSCIGLNLQKWGGEKQRTKGLRGRKRARLLYNFGCSQKQSNNDYTFLHRAWMISPLMRRRALRESAHTHTPLRRKSNMNRIYTAVHLWTEKCNFSHICIWSIHPGAVLKRHLSGGFHCYKKVHDLKSATRLSTVWNCPLINKPAQNGPK